LGGLNRLSSSSSVPRVLILRLLPPFPLAAPTIAAAAASTLYLLCEGERWFHTVGMDGGKG